MKTFHHLALWACMVSSGISYATPSGERWFTVPTTYRVFKHSQIKGISDFMNVALPTIQTAFATWTQQSCTTWQVTYLGTFTTPTGTSAVTGTDRNNSVIWLSGNAWRYGSATLGLTTTSYFPGTGEIFDADMEMNNNVTWSTLGAGSPQSYDLESVVLHEAGHFLGLEHTTSSAVAVMYPTVNMGTAVRALSTLDINDVCSVYPRTTGGQGSPCGSGSVACASGLVCRGDSTNASKICTVDCSAGQTCPSGYSCQTAEAGKACLVPTGSTDLCKFCTDGSQCANGICVTNGRNNWCTVACVNSQSCGPGYTCVPGGSGNVCVPQASCSGQCTSSNECAVGYGCVNGVCEATGKTGERCEISAYCEGCHLCIGTNEEAYCLGCCGGQGMGGTCNGCSATNCSSGYGCSQVNGSSDQVCVPNPGVNTCGSCSSSSPCAQGLTCIGGKCHAACRPSSPGNCLACYAVSDSVGYCACPSESRKVGESCGVSANGNLAACLTGLKCVGMPSPICRQPCDPNVSGSCSTSEQCKSIDSQFVCMPNTLAGSVCGSCNNGQCALGLTCLGDRCYTPCSSASSSCSDCVLISGSTGVCACSDQKSAAGQACGFAPPSEIRSCQASLTCVNSTCRQSCDPSNDTCPEGTSCEYNQGNLLCLPDGESTDGGSLGMNENLGCGCQTQASSFWMLGLLFLALRHGFRTHRW